MCLLMFACLANALSHYHILNRERPVRKTVPNGIRKAVKAPGTAKYNGEFVFPSAIHSFENMVGKWHMQHNGWQ